MKNEGSLDEILNMYSIHNLIPQFSCVCVNNTTRDWRWSVDPQQLIIDQRGEAQDNLKEEGNTRG